MTLGAVWIAVYVGEEMHLVDEMFGADGRAEHFGARLTAVGTARLRERTHPSFNGLPLIEVR